MTRIKIDTPGGEVTADVPTARMGTVAIGARVRASFPADSPRLLSLAGEPESASAEPDPDDL